MVSRQATIYLWSTVVLVCIRMAHNHLADVPIHSMILPARTASAFRVSTYCTKNLVEPSYKLLQSVMHTRAAIAVAGKDSCDSATKCQSLERLDVLRMSNTILPLVE